MSIGYDVHATKRPVNLSLNEDLVRKARAFTGNLSEQVERLLRDYVVAEQMRRDEQERRLDSAIAAWNAFDNRHGAFADEHADL